MEYFTLYQWLVLALLSLIALFLWIGICKAPTVDSLEAMTQRLENAVRGTSIG